MNDDIKLKIETLRNIKSIQKASLTNNYMFGLYNGLELALSIFENRDPELKEISNVNTRDIFHTGKDD